MRVFRGYRPHPPEGYEKKGLSNGGWAPDYEGIEFTDGTIVVRWRTAYHSTAIFKNWETFDAVHGHSEYGTQIRWYRVEDENYATLYPSDKKGKPS